MAFRVKNKNGIHTSTYVCTYTYRVAIKMKMYCILWNFIAFAQIAQRQITPQNKLQI
jgi:hypothetical protein